MTLPKGMPGPALIAHLRRVNGHSQEQLAHRSGLSARSIGKLERGLIARPRLATLVALADALGLDDVEQERFVAELRKANDSQATGNDVPAQLPPADAGFVGRHAELAQLDELLRDPQGPGGLVVIEGDAGLGKTALALHWAHSARDAFPDGQIFARLHGFSVGSPADPADLLAHFLTACGEPAEQVPTGVDARSALLRTRLAGQRVLIVLDDAADSEQVLPLLPGAETCATVITSRRRLVGLSTRYRSRHLVLKPMPVSEAADLLRTEPTARPDAGQLDRAVGVCGGMPLALRILASQAQDRGWSYVLDLLDTVPALDAVSLTSDRAASVRQVLSTSVENLSAAATELFGMIGLVATPDVSRHVLAAMAGWALGRTDRAADELIALHLVTPRDGRLVVHDLVQDYARELADQWQVEHRDAAFARLAGVLIEIATGAKPSIVADEEVPAEPSRLSSVDLDLPGRPVRWLAGQRAIVEQVVDWACTTNAGALTWRLADALRDHVQHFMWDVDTDRFYRAASDEAARGGDVLACSRAERYLGSSQMRRGDRASGQRHLNQALELARRGESILEEAEATAALAEMYYRICDYQRALEGFSRTHELRQQVGVRRGEALALSNIAVCHSGLGHYDEAEVWLQKAVRAAESSGSHDALAWALGNLGSLYQRRGDLEAARDATARAWASTADSEDRETQLLAALQYAEVCLQLELIDLADSLLEDIELSGLSTTTNLDMQSYLQNCTAELAFLRSDLTGASRLFERVVDRAARGHDQVGLAKAHLGLARIATQHGDRLAATRHFTAARECGTRLDPCRQALIDEHFAVPTAEEPGREHAQTR